MPKKPVDEDRARRKELLEQKKAARRAAAAQQQEQSLSRDAAGNTAPSKQQQEKEEQQEQHRPCYLIALPDDALHVLLAFLPAADLTRLLLLTGSSVLYQWLTKIDQHHHDAAAAADHDAVTTTTAWSSAWILSRLYAPYRRCGRVGWTQLVTAPADVRRLLQSVSSALAGWCNPHRPGHCNNNNNTHSKHASSSSSSSTSSSMVGVPALWSYLRFLDEGVAGYATILVPSPVLSTRTKLLVLPPLVQGRFASCSPEHSLCRMGGTDWPANRSSVRRVGGAVSGSGSGGSGGGGGGGGGTSGSGVASWGVGRRGQLGHGQRGDERFPKRLLLSQKQQQQQQQLLLYDPSPSSRWTNPIRIVQVSAGGGLVRIAHSLFLTDTGHVYSCGSGQYGALGHGYTAAKTLPDLLQPTLIESLVTRGYTCVGVAAGELHSAVVTTDGDVLTWGDGFCGAWVLCCVIVSCDCVCVIVSCYCCQETNGDGKAFA